ncbi:unnamed protein product [Chrysoparadoxa australica]
MDEPPICRVCNHRHHQGEKCPICGHQGRGKIYRLLADGPVPVGLSFCFFDRRTPEKAFQGKWALAKIIRNRVFVEEMGAIIDEEFGEEDNTSRHALVQVGDAPVGYARWHVAASPDMEPIALIDRLCLLPGYRGRGYARKCTEKLIEDINKSVAEKQIVASAIVTLVPPNTFMYAKLQAANFVQQGGLLDFRGTPCAKMCLVASAAPP